MNKVELQNRLLNFSKNLIRVTSKIPKTPVNIKLIDQAVRSGTSIGANYMEACAAESQRDFKHKLNISFKESAETRYWLDIFTANNAQFKKELSLLLQESDEIVRILGKSISTCTKNQMKK